MDSQRGFSDTQGTPISGTELSRDIGVSDRVMDCVLSTSLQITNLIDDVCCVFFIVMIFDIVIVGSCVYCDFPLLLRSDVDLSFPWYQFLDFCLTILV